MDARIEVAERQHLEMVDQLADPFDARQQRRHHDHGPRALRHSAQEVEARQPPRNGEARAQALYDARSHLAGGQQQEQRHPSQRPGRVTVTVRVEEAEAEQQGGQEPDRPEVGRGGMGEDEAPHAPPEARTVRHVGLEIEAASADQVVADVDRATAHTALGGLARALDGAEGHAELTLSAAVGQVLHRLAIAVAAREVHASIDARRVALQHAFDQAHRLEVLAPVECREQAQAGDDVGHGDLRRRLALVFATDRLFRGRLLRLEQRVHGRAHRREARTVLAHALQQLHDEGGMDLRRQGQRLTVAGRVDLRHVGVGRATRLPRLARLLRQAPQVLEERELQHARPGPQLADGQRRNGLEAVHEADELLAVQAAVAVPDQLHGHRVDAGVARQLARRELGQLAVVAARQVLADVADLRGHQVIVVEQPLRRGRDELPLVHVLGHREVRLAQDARVVGEARKDVAGAPPQLGIDDQARRQRLGPLLEPLDAQQLVAQRLLGRIRVTPAQPVQQFAEGRRHGHLVIFLQSGEFEPHRRRDQAMLARGRSAELRTSALSRTSRPGCPRQPGARPPPCDA